MNQFAEGLWELSTPIRFAGVRMPARTVIAALGGGGLVVHSPGRLDGETREAVERIGPVRGLIAPNRFHHLFLDDWREAYPEAEVHVAPGLANKRPDLDGVAQVLGDEPPALWAGEIDQHMCGGIPKIGEVVFCHRPSRTLLNTDMMHNMRDEPRWFARTAWKMLGAYGRFGPSRMEKWLTKDKVALRATVDAMLAWDFDRVTVAHGDILESGGKDAVASGWTWI